jgi:hypothetical protein
LPKDFWQKTTKAPAVALESLRSFVKTIINQTSTSFRQFTSTVQNNPGSVALIVAGTLIVSAAVVLVRKSLVEFKQKPDSQADKPGTKSSKNEQELKQKGSSKEPDSKERSAETSIPKIDQQKKGTSESESKKAASEDAAKGTALNKTTKKSDQKPIQVTSKNDQQKGSFLNGHRTSVPVKQAEKQQGSKAPSYTKKKIETKQNGTAKKGAIKGGGPAAETSAKKPKTPKQVGKTSNDKKLETPRTSKEAGQNGKIKHPKRASPKKKHKPSNTLKFNSLALKGVLK